MFSTKWAAHWSCWRQITGSRAPAIVLDLDKGLAFERKTFILDIHRLNSTLLQTFLVVAEAGQISKAARRLHLCQPAVTGQIRRLESDLDTTLFIRSAHGVSLTPRGGRLRKRLQGVFVELEQ